MTGQHRGPDGRYGYRPDDNARGPVTVTCAGCGRDIPPDELIYVDRERYVFIGDGYVTSSLPIGPWCAQCEGTAKPGNRPWNSAGRHAYQDGGWTWIPEPPHCCRTCGRMFRAARAAYCSDRCENAGRTDRQRAAREGLRSRRQCSACGEFFAAPRGDARYCSPACRQKAYRERKSAQAATRAAGAALIASYSAGLLGGDR